MKQSRAGRRGPLRVVPGIACAESIRTLERMLEAARAGRLVGLAYCAVQRSGGYSVDFVGLARRDLTRTRGMVCALDDEIGVQISERAMEAPDAEPY